MESKKINQLATNVAPQTSDLTIIGDPITGVSKKITLLQIANLFATTGTVTSVAVTETGNALTITGSPITSAGTINIGFAGDATQYVRGDGALADFPTSTGGGSSVSYYLNSSVSQGTIGGVAYREFSKDPIAGAGTDITASTNGYIASYITDANDPALLEVPAGNFNCELYFSVDSNAHNPYVYAEIYKYDGTTFTLIGSSQSVPEYLTNGTTLSPYYFAIPVTQTTLAITDRIAIRIYVNVDTRVVTLHTENNHLCQVVTTFSKGLTSLNNLTRQVQFFGTGTSGTDFNISSSTATHTFNIPNASATNRGLITTEAQTIAGAKVFDNPITGNSGIAFLNGVMPNITSNLYSGIGGNSQGISIITRPVSTNYTNNFYFPSASNSYTFPNATGTIALTSDISYPVTSVFGRTGAVVAASGDYTTTQVTEGTNLYFTDARSRAALSAGTGISYNNGTGVITSTITQYTDALARAALSFTAGSGAYNSTTGVITIPTDNNQIANGAGYITSSALSGYLPLTGGTLTGGLNGTTATFSGLGTFYQLTMTGATAGRLFYAQTGGVFSQSGNLVWNNSTEMLGVGTPNPSAVITAFSTNAATQLKAAGTAPAITFSNTLTSASLACVFGLATANNHFVTGTAPGDMAIANQSTSAGAIIFGTGTFEKMRMTSAGTFSIGNTNSTYNLDVTGTGRFTSTLLVGGAATFSSSVTATGGLISNGGAIGYGGGELGFGVTTSGALSAIYTLATGSPTLFFDHRGTSNTGSFAFRNGTGGANTLMTITSGGNVGIGTSSPNSRLNVVGDAATNGLTIKSAGNGGTFPFRVTWSGGSDGSMLCVNDNGNVGIGTSSPAALLQLEKSSFPEQRITDGTIGFQMYGSTGSGEFVQGTYSNHALVFRTNAVERARITSGGRVLIGVTTNAAGGALAVASNGVVVYDGANYRQMYQSSSAMYWFNGSNEAYLSSAGVWTNASDISIKKDINDIKYGLNEVMKLKPKSYKMIDDDLEQIGFIAQDVEELLPELVGTSERGMKGLSYGNLTAVLTKAIQEQQAQIEELSNKIVALESK
jgi:hypothetical protein